MDTFWPGISKNAHQLGD